MAEFDMGRRVWVGFLSKEDMTCHLGWMESWCGFTINNHRDSAQIPQNLIPVQVTCPECLALYAAKRLGLEDLGGSTATRMSRLGIIR